MKLLWLVLALLLSLGAVLGYYYKKLTSHKVSGQLSFKDDRHLVVFDFDGTLADTYDELVTSFNTIAHEYGIKKVNGEDAQKFKDKEPKEILNHLGVNRFQLIFLAKKLNGVLSQKIDGIKPFKGIPEVLKELSRDYHLGILTSNSYENVTHFLDKYNLREYFHFIISDVGTFGKTKALDHMIELSEHPPSISIYIGDEIRDGFAAKEAGIAFGAVSYGINSARLLKKVDPVFMADDPQELPRKLATYWQSLDS